MVKIGDSFSENGNSVRVGFENKVGGNYSFAYHNNIINCSKKGKPNTLEFRENGDIYVHGKLIENDKQIVEGLREFLNNICK